MCGFHQMPHLVQNIRMDNKYNNHLFHLHHSFMRTKYDHNQINTENSCSEELYLVNDHAGHKLVNEIKRWPRPGNT